MAPIDRRQIPNPDRIRAIPPEGFAWIDRNLLRQGWLARMSPEARGLYLFLCLAADAHGVSWWSDPRIGHSLQIPHNLLVRAREELCLAGLIAYRFPLYQVLPLPAPVTADRGPREPIAIGRALEDLLRRCLHGSRPVGRDSKAP